MGILNGSPNKYKRLDYITASGTQYINLGIYPTQNMKMQLKFMYEHAEGYAFVGSVSTSDFDDTNDYRIVNISDHSQTYIDLGDNDLRINEAYATDPTAIYECEFGNNYLKDIPTGNIIVSGDTMTIQNTDVPIRVFTGGDKQDYGKIYYLKIFDGNTLLMDLIPCQTNKGEIGLFDKLTDKFYGNSGTGSLIAGNVVETFDVYNKKIVAIYLGRVNVTGGASSNAATFHIDEGNTKEVYVDNGMELSGLVTPTKAGYTFAGWREDNTASADVFTSKTMGSEPITLYAVFKKNYTLNAVSYNSTQKVTGELYYNNGNITDPTVTIPTGASYSGHTWRGWSASGATAANANVSYANGGNITLQSESTTIYGLYQKEITVTYYNNSSTASTTKGTRYYNAAGNISNPSFNLSQAGVSGWSARGWSTGTAGNSGVTYNNATAFTRDSNVTLYGTYQKTVTLSYNGNGSTSGSVSSHSGTAYRNYAGTVIGVSFTLKSNGFAKTGYNFNKWDLGAVGAAITLSDSKTAYAQWTQVWSNSLTVFTATDSSYYFKYGGTLTNSEHVTYSFHENPISAGAHINNEYGDESEQQNHGTITIDYKGFYTRAVIELYDASHNEYNGDREAWYRYWISGQTEPGWQGITSSVHTVTMHASSGQTVLNLGARANINGDNGGLYTWVDAALAIKSITLYKD